MLKDDSSKDSMTKANQYKRKPKRKLKSTITKWIILLIVFILALAIPVIYFVNYGNNQESLNDSAGQERDAYAVAESAEPSASEASLNDSARQEKDAYAETESAEPTASEHKLIETQKAQLVDLTSALIAIIAVAVAVWIGLNLYNTLGRNELNDINNRITFVEDKANSLDKSLKDAQTALDESFKNAQTALDNALKKSVLRTIYQGQNFYLSSEYIYQKIDENETSLDSDALNFILEIENTFLAASEINRNNRGTAEATREKLCCSGTKNLNELEALLKKRKESDNFLKGYISLRQGDFRFYQGYRIPAKECLLSEAIRFYKVALKTWFNLNTESEINEQKAIWNDLSESGKYCVAYLYNVIGECDNVQTQPGFRWCNNGTEHSMANERAIKSFKLCNEVGESIKATSGGLRKNYATYKRNYAVALDISAKLAGRSSSTDDSLYRESIEINPNDQRSYWYVADRICSNPAKTPDDTRREINSLIKYICINPCADKVDEAIDRLRRLLGI